jgi:tetratricopeptide (TPR) repeat protein
LGYLLFFSGRYAEVAAAAGRAVELAQAVGDDNLLGRGKSMQVFALIKAGQAGAAARMEKAGRLAEEAASLAEATGDLDVLYEILNSLAYLRVISGDFGASSPFYERAGRVAEQLHDPACDAFTGAMQGWVAFLRGAWGKSRTALTQALALCRRAGLPWATAYVLLHQGQLALAEGEWEDASRCLDEAAALAAQGGDIQALRQASSLLAELDVLGGRPDAARARLTPLLDRSGLEEYDVTALLPALAWAHLELGDIARAGDVASQAIARTRPEGLRLVLVDALRVRALAYLQQGQVEEAAAALEEGLALTQRMPYPYVEARLMRVFGEVHMQAGAVEAARTRLEAALVIFRRLGARKDLEQVEKELGALQAQLLE